MKTSTPPYAFDVNRLRDREAVRMAAAQAQTRIRDGWERLRRCEDTGTACNIRIERAVELLDAGQMGPDDAALIIVRAEYEAALVSALPHPRRSDEPTAGDDHVPF